MDAVALAEVRAAAGALTGAIEQVPPMVSAVKVGGRRLHALAREGIEVERAARPVTVHRFDVAPGLEPGRVPDRGGVLVGHLRPGAGRRPGHGPGRRCPPPEPAADPDRVVLGRGRPAGRRADPGGGAHPGPGPAGPRPGGGARRGAASRWPGAWPSTGCRSGVTGDGPWGLVDDGHRLLAVYEATETDRIRPAVVLEAAG